MKITCLRDKLAAAFQMAASVAPARSPKQILQNVKLEVTEGKGTLMATDMELGIRIEVPGIEVHSLGSAVLPVARFGSILRESSDASLQLETDGHSTVVRGERSEFKLQSQDPQEFPYVATFDQEKYHKMPARLMREMIRRTIFATDTESSRYALGGVLWELTEKEAIAVGTDGRRLAKMEGPATAVSEHNPGEANTIVPTKAMQLIEKGLAAMLAVDADAYTLIATTDRAMVIKCQKVIITSSLAEGRFPSWREVFPKRNNAQRINLNVATAVAAVRQAAIITSEESKAVDFTFDSGLLVLTASVAEAGQSRIELPIAYEGPAITMSLDPRYVIDFLKVLDGDKTFVMEIENADDAVVCSTDDGYSYIIMPLSRDP